MTGILIGIGLVIPLGLMMFGPSRALLGWIAVLATLVSWLAVLVRLANGNPGSLEASQWWVSAGLLVLLAVLGLRSVRGIRGHVRDRINRVLLALGGLALAVRLLFPHQILHPELMGGLVLSEFFQFPEPATSRASYGQFPFLLVGLPAALIPRIATVTTTHAVLSALTVVLTGHLVRRISGSGLAAIGTALLGALHPSLTLAGTSEDPSTVGLFAFFGGWLALDFAADGRERRMCLAVGTALLVLAAWSRQTLIPLLILPFAASLERQGWKILRDPGFFGAGLAVANASLLQVFMNRGLASNQVPVAYYGSALLFAWPHVLSEPHPLLDPVLAPFPLPLLILVGLAAPRRLSRCRWTLRLGFAWAFLLTAPMALFGPGIEVVHRVPVLFLGTLLGGTGVVVAREWARHITVVVRNSAALALAFMGLLCIGAGFLRLSAPDPQTQELSFLEKTLSHIPAGTVVVAPDHEDLFSNRMDPTDPVPHSRVPDFLIRWNPHLTFMTLREARARPPLWGGVFYRGLGCYSVTLLEGSPRFRDLFHRAVASQRVPVREFLEAVYELREPSNQPNPDLPRRLRTVCFDERMVGEPIAVQTITRPQETSVPNLFFPSERMEIGFYRLGVVR